MVKTSIKNTKTLKETKMKNVSAIITGFAVALIALGVNAAETAAPVENKKAAIKEEIKDIKKEKEDLKDKKEELKEKKEMKEEMKEEKK